jgi:hypothetical protein
MDVIISGFDLVSDFGCPVFESPLYSEHAIFGHFLLSNG